MTAVSICAFPLLNPLLTRAASVLEGNNIFGRPRNVGDDEADARIRFAWMPFHSLAITRRGRRAPFEVAELVKQ